MHVLYKLIRFHLKLFINFLGSSDWINFSTCRSSIYCGLYAYQGLTWLFCAIHFYSVRFECSKSVVQIRSGQKI